MEITFAQLLRLIRKNLLPILICTAVCAAAGVAAAEFAVPKTYVSTVKLYVSTPESEQDSVMNINALDYAQKVVNTYIEMLRTDSFFGKVLERAGVGCSMEQMKKMVDFSPLNNTEVFQAQVCARSPEEAKRIADAITELAPVTIGSLKENASLKVVDRASLPEKPSSPSAVLFGAAGLLAGALGSLGTVLLRNSLNVRIKNEEELQEKSGIPVLATIPAFNRRYAKGGNH